MTRFIALTLVALLAGSPRQEAVDPGVRSAIERFYAAQEAEDSAAYLALWSRNAQRPRPEQLKFIFDSGDDKFSTITITRTTTVGDQLVVRVSVIRDRTSATMRRPDGSPIVSHSAMTASLAYVKEDGGWKLVREGTPVDGLAMALLAAATVEARESLLAAEPELVGLGLLSALSRQGDTFAQTGQYGKAQTVYERVAETARRMGNKKGEGEALQNVANAMYYQRNFMGALAAYEQRLAVEREAASDEGIASALLGDEPRLARAGGGALGWGSDADARRCGRSRNRPVGVARRRSANRRDRQMDGRRRGCDGIADGVLQAGESRRGAGGGASGSGRGSARPRRHTRSLFLGRLDAHRAVTFSDVTVGRAVRDRSRPAGTPGP